MLLFVKCIPGITEVSLLVVPLVMNAVVRTEVLFPEYLVGMLYVTTWFCCNTVGEGHRK